MNTQTLVGIDLGTSYSSLSRLDKRFEAQPVPNKEGDLKTPSVVYIQEGGQGVIVGKHALDSGFSHPERFFAHVKRHLGDPEAGWDVDGVVYTPVDISAFIMRKLIQDAEKEYGPIRQAVVTVPAHFTSYQRELTVQAAKQAGLETVHLMNEPVAAALYVAFGQEYADGYGEPMVWLHNDCTILVYDLGGGTFDLSLVRYDQRQLRVLATGGELRLGGLDWDQRLIDDSAPVFQRQGIDLGKAEHSEALLRLGMEIEKAKCRLSEETLRETHVLLQYRGKEARYAVDREKIGRAHV